MSTPLLAAAVALAVLAGTVGPAEAPVEPNAPVEPHAPGVAPVPGAVLRGFEPPAQPYGPGHRGVALAAAPGEPVRAALAGRVFFSGEVARVGWVSIDHGGGLLTSYGPLDPRLVRRDERVVRGEVIGRRAADGGHLHWGARLHGTYIDPLLLLGGWEVYLRDERSDPLTQPGVAMLVAGPGRRATRAAQPSGRAATSQHDRGTCGAAPRARPGPFPSGPGV